jgi:hypothetical protein
VHEHSQLYDEEEPRKVCSGSMDEGYSSRIVDIKKEAVREKDALAMMEC